MQRLNSNHSVTTAHYFAGLSWLALLVSPWAVLALLVALLSEALVPGWMVYASLLVCLMALPQVFIGLGLRASARDEALEARHGHA